MRRGSGFGGSGRGQSGSRGGGGDRRMSGSAGVGPGGECICPSCGQKASHERGIPCAMSKCPKCDTTMVRA